MTLLEMVNQVTADTGRTDKIAQIRIYLDQAQRRVVQAGAKKDYDFKDLRVIDSSISTVAQQETINLPADCRAVLDLVLLDGSDSAPLRFRPPRIYDKECPFPMLSFGRPTIYTQKVSGKLHLAKDVPSKSYKMCLHYSKWPATMVNDNDEPNLKNADDLLIALANYRLYMSLDLPGKAVSWKIAANEMFSEYMESDKQKEDWHPVAKGFSTDKSEAKGEYWKNPFYKG